MRILRWIGVILFGLVGGGFTFLSCGEAFATLQRGYEAWRILWIFLLGLPLAAVFLGTAWALGAGRRVRPVAGTLLAIAALAHTLVLAGAIITAAIAVARSTNLLAVIAFVPAAMFWPVPVFLTVLSGLLLRKQGLRWTSSLFMVKGWCGSPLG